MLEAEKTVTDILSTGSSCDDKLMPVMPTFAIPAKASRLPDISYYSWTMDVTTSSFQDTEIFMYR